MILWTSKSGTEVEKRIFGGDCSGGCMHKWGCEN